MAARSTTGNPGLSATILEDLHEKSKHAAELIRRNQGCIGLAYSITGYAVFEALQVSVSVRVRASAPQK
jgi:hypothetical protein